MLYSGWNDESSDWEQDYTEFKALSQMKRETKHNRSITVWQTLDRYWSLHLNKSVYHLPILSSPYPPMF
jgi:hypothetical protein